MRSKSLKCHYCKKVIKSDGSNSEHIVVYDMDVEHEETHSFCNQCSSIINRAILADRRINGHSIIQTAKNYKNNFSILKQNLKKK